MFGGATKVFPAGGIPGVGNIIPGGNNTPKKKAKKNKFDQKEKDCKDYLASAENQKLRLLKKSVTVESPYAKIESVLKSVGAQSSDVLIALWCAKEMIPDPKQIVFTKFLANLANSKVALTQHAKETEAIFNGKNYSPSDFAYSKELKTSKLYDAFWDYSKYATNVSRLTDADGNVQTLLKDPSTDKSGDKTQWDASCKEGAQNVSKVYNDMQRKDTQSSAKKDIGDAYIYAFLANAAYDANPFAQLENSYEYKKKQFAQESQQGEYVPNLVTKLSHQVRCNYTLPAFKPFYPPTSDFTGLLGGRKLKVAQDSKDCFKNLQAMWKKNVSGGKTPLDEVLGGGKGNSGIGKVDLPRYCVGYNDRWRELVVIVRGTSEFGDLLTDMVCFAMPSACGRGFCHGQMQISAIIIAMSIYKQLKEQMATGKYDRITCVGHSLGAGTASLLGILLNTPLEQGGAGFEGKVRVFGYGTPPVICDKTSDSSFVSDTDGYIVAVVNQHDIIPRFAIQNLSAMVWWSNNNGKVAPKGETKEKKKGGGGMFSSGASFVGDMTKKAASAVGGAIGDKVVEKLKQVMKDVLKFEASGQADGFEFKNMWIPGSVHNISYKFEGKKKGEEGIVTQKLTSCKISGRTQAIEVEKKECMCYHKVPRNSPRVCYIIMDAQSVLDHLMGQYIPHLAQLYDATPGDDYLLPPPGAKPKAPEASGGCCIIC